MLTLETTPYQPVKSSLPHTLVVIDPAVEAPQILVNHLIPEAQALLLDPHRDGIDQITQAWASGHYQNLHLIGHGAPNTLYLSNSVLNPDTLHRYSHQLQTWNAHEIHIYACHLASPSPISPSPQPRWRSRRWAHTSHSELLTQLHHLTGANLAGATGRVGNTDRGGTWHLDVQIGEITQGSAITPQGQQAYPGTFPVSFSSPTTFGVGDYPSSITVGDFDRDGNPDLATTNQGSNNVSVLLGDGSGGFGDQTTFGVGNRPSSVVVGDFDGDNNPDLAVTDTDDHFVSVLLGDGSGSFAPQVIFRSAVSSPESIVVGDFDGDGNDDLATANSGSDNVSVLLGDGNGGFDQTTFGVGESPSSITVGDFDRDGNPDLATANEGSNNVSVLLGNGNGGFGSQTTFGNLGSPEEPIAITVGDFNGDGNPDLATADFDDHDISLLLGDGNGSFDYQKFPVLGDAAESLVVGDFDGDGNDDLATASTIGDVSVALGDGSGGFAPEITFEVGDGQSAITVGDFNKDGNPDLATAAGYSGDTVSVLLNQPPVSTIYVSTATYGTVDGISFRDEDILAYDSLTGTWSRHFDGSDLGLSGTDVNAFHIDDDGSILLSLKDATTVPGLGTVDNSDIVRFIPTSTGNNTAGTFEWYFDGSDVGLDSNSEDIYAIARTPDGRLVISTRGSATVPGLSSPSPRDEDLLVFNDTSLGETTSGTWDFYFDGSDEQLNTNSDEDIYGSWIDANGDIYLTTKGSFSVSGLSGDGADIFTCNDPTTGVNTSCSGFSPFFDGSANGLAGETIDGFSLV